MWKTVTQPKVYDSCATWSGEHELKLAATWIATLTRGMELQRRGDNTRREEYGDGFLVFLPHYDSKLSKHLETKATMDLGTATKKVSVQCNVGKKSPVLLCSLLPDKWESCPLCLEFQESDEVTFSVIGPRSVYLTGYYVNGSHVNDDSESYGEDIVHTDCEKSLRSSDEDDYEDSFINDGDLDVLSSSSLSTGKGDPKANIKKGKHRRLRKCTLNVSGDDDSSHNEICNTSGQTPSGTNSDLNTDIEQPIEEITVVPKFSNMGVGQATGSDDKTVNMVELINEVDAFGENDKSREDIVLATDVVPESGKRKRRKDLEGDKFQDDADLSKTMLKTGGTVSRRKLRKNHSTKGEVISEMDKVSEKSTLKERPRKRKKHSHDNGHKGHLEVHKILKGDVNVVKSKDTHAIDEEYNNSNFDKGIHHPKKSKKGNMKRESGEVGDIACGMGVSPTTKEKNSTLNNTTSEKSSKEDTINSTDITIEEIEVGNTDGKIASLGKKVRIHYVGRLKGDEEIIHSNVEQAPFKFLLGGETVIEGWNVGLEGMRVGGKRKLIIPPSMAYGSEGDGSKIPPNSWLEYVVELVRVH